MRLRKWKKAFIYISLMCSSITYAQYTEKDILNYIDTYHQLAIQKMKDYGIPASITLAQGILESAAGTSDLAREANNHFGIKCHSIRTMMLKMNVFAPILPLSNPMTIIRLF